MGTAVEISACQPSGLFSVRALAGGWHEKRDGDGSGFVSAPNGRLMGASSASNGRIMGASAIWLWRGGALPSHPALWGGGRLKGGSEGGGKP